jgi:hypothetical protein
MHIHPYDQSFVDAVRSGGVDAYGMPAERSVSDGQGNPCRSCLHQVPAGEGMLILAARPFPAPQPYAETGPIFLCEGACTPWAGEGLPPVLRSSSDYLAKGYSAEHRIVYGTGKVVGREALAEYAEGLLSDPRVAYVDIRSSRNNCFLARITR